MVARQPSPGRSKPQFCSGFRQQQCAQEAGPPQPPGDVQSGTDNRATRSAVPMTGDPDPAGHPALLMGPGQRRPGVALCRRGRRKGGAPRGFLTLTPRDRRRVPGETLRGHPSARPQPACFPSYGCEIIHPSSFSLLFGWASVSESIPMGAGVESVSCRVRAYHLESSVMCRLSTVPSRWRWLPRRVGESSLLITRERLP